MNHGSKLLTAIVPLVLVQAQIPRVEAQAVVVQQPVVQQFGVSTVVSVPDRGSALLGSVSSSTMFGRRVGPLNGGAIVSRRQQQAGASAHVWIHDFEAMDAALLAAGGADGRRRGIPGGSPESLTGMSAVACGQLLEQHEQIVRRGSGLDHLASSRRTLQPPSADIERRWPTNHAAAGSSVSRFGR